MFSAFRPQGGKFYYRVVRNKGDLLLFVVQPIFLNWSPIGAAIIACASLLPLLPSAPSGDSALQFGWRPRKHRSELLAEFSRFHDGEVHQTANGKVLAGPRPRCIGFNVTSLILRPVFAWEPDKLSNALVDFFDCLARFFWRGVALGQLQLQYVDQQQPEAPRVP